ncbi:MAG: DUF3160 domain-containing protein [Candidatus Xenobiia bacterium LiM19]
MHLPRRIVLLLFLSIILTGSGCSSPASTTGKIPTASSADSRHYFAEPSPVYAPEKKGPDLRADLSTVNGLEWLKGPDSAKKLLKKNGFVVVPHYYRQIFSPYIQEKELPPFITTDSLFATFHIIFENQVKLMEKDFAGDLRELTSEMLAEIRKLPGDACDKDSRFLCTAYLSVAACLLEDSFVPEPSVRKAVHDEMALIREGKSVARSPLFGYEIDYSQFSPRGFYTDSNTLKSYFRAMSWYGNCAFRIVSERETRAAAVMAMALAGDEKACAIWRKMDRIYSAFMASSDDITPLRYAELKTRAGTGPDWLTEFIREAGREPDPTINSMVLRAEEMPRWKELTKGMRFFGKRYVPDSQIFMYLTFPEVKGRPLPSGLDIMAANGSARARELLEKEGAFSHAGYEEGLAKSEKIMEKVKNDRNLSCYGDFLFLAETLTSPEKETTFPFMRTEAYEDKNLMTALGGWASMRHTWQLQVKTGAIWGCLTDYEQGWVEPNVEFYERLHGLIRHTSDALKPVKGAHIGRLEKLGALVDLVKNVAIKQQRGEKLSENEVNSLHRYGETIAGLSYFDGNVYEEEQVLPWMSCIADVHYEYLNRVVREVGRGPAMPIYVAIPVKGRYALAVGGVFTYYQLTSPLSGNITDEKWKKMTEAGVLPPLPWWTGSFICGNDAKLLIRRLKAGEKVDEIASVESSEVVKALEEGIRPGGVFEKSGNLCWAIEMYGNKAGRKAVPLMLEYLKKGELREVYTSTHLEYTMTVSYAAAQALCMIAGPEEVPALAEIGKGNDRNRAGLAALVLLHIGGDSARNALYDIYRVSHDESICSIFLFSRLKSSTPFFINEFKKSRKPSIINSLGWIWGDVDYSEYNYNSNLGFVYTIYSMECTISDNITPEQEKSLRKEVEKLILSTIPSENQELSDAAVGAAGELGIYESLPLLEKRLKSSHNFFSYIRTLGKLKCDDSCRILIELEKDTGLDEKGSIISAMAELRNPECIPVLKRLLDVKYQTDYSDVLICDCAARALMTFYPEGPVWSGNDSSKASRKDLDDYVKKWKIYLAEKK